MTVTSDYMNRMRARQAHRGHSAVHCELCAVLILAAALLPACGAPPGPEKWPTLAPVDGPPSDLRESARLALDRYVRLHRAIMDPRDTSVEKKFLVLQPLLGMGNSQIEEVHLCVCVCLGGMACLRALACAPGACVLIGVLCCTRR